MSTSPCFELSNYKDLFAKALKDYNDFKKLVNSHDLFNFLCTVNHLSEWYEKETGVKVDTEKYPLKLIRDLCDRAKHFELRANARNHDTDVASGWGAGRYGAGVYGVGEPSYYVSYDGNKISMLKVCDDAIEFWKNEIK